MDAKIVMYCPYSFGGAWDYALHLSHAFSTLPQTQYALLTATTAHNQQPWCHKILTADQLPQKPAWQQKLHFLWRSVANPFRLIKYIKTLPPGSKVIMNDFEQLTAPLWYGRLRQVAQARKVSIGVVLHDPDRNAYFPVVKLSEITTRMVLAPAKAAFYHELLPNRPYYNTNKTKFINVPHGLYPPHSPNQALTKSLQKQKIEGINYFAMVGNIRLEKNYHLAIKALARAPKAGLIIAGRPASSSVNIDELKNLAVKLGVSNRIIWHTYFLSEHEMASVITQSHCVLLAYSKTFVSQSGVLFLTASYQKPLIASQTESAMAVLVDKFKIGQLIKPDSLPHLAQAMDGFEAWQQANPTQWAEFEAYSSWTRCAKLMIESL